MIPSRIAHQLAIMRMTRLLLRSCKLTSTEAEEFTAAFDELVRAAVQELRSEIEAERDEVRRKFFSANPSLQKGCPIMADNLRIEAQTPDAAHLEKSRDVPVACSPSVIRAVP